MPNMPITNWAAWGTLVLDWVKDASKRPRDIAALNQQMAQNNVGGAFSQTDYQSLAFCQAPNESTLQLFLPTQSQVDRAIQDLNGGAPWTLPDFYSRDAFNGQPVNVKDADKLKFLAERIGDYAIGQCA
jgi:hypothetical protein